MEDSTSAHAERQSCHADNKVLYWGKDTLKSVKLECRRTAKLLSTQLTIPENLKRLWAQRLSKPTVKVDTTRTWNPRLDLRVNETSL